MTRRIFKTLPERIKHMAYLRLLVITKCVTFAICTVNILSPGGGIGRHAGLKILWPVMAVPVRARLRVHDMRTVIENLD
jgi:hypothetical protein